MSSPSLWSTFVVALNDCSYPEVSSLLPLFDAHVQRSRAAPLTLAITLIVDHQWRGPFSPFYAAVA